MLHARIEVVIQLSKLCFSATLCSICSKVERKTIQLYLSRTQFHLDFYYCLLRLATAVQSLREPF